MPQHSRRPGPCRPVDESHENSPRRPRLCHSVTPVIEPQSLGTSTRLGEPACVWTMAVWGQMAHVSLSVSRNGQWRRGGQITHSCSGTPAS